MCVKGAKKELLAGVAAWIAVLLVAPPAVAHAGCESAPCLPYEVFDERDNSARAFQSLTESDGAPAADDVGAMQAVPSEESSGPIAAQGEPRQAASPAERAATIRIPVLVDGVRYPDILATITTSTVLAISGSELAASLTSVISDDLAAQLVALGTAPVAVERIREAGLEVAFDPQSISLAIVLSPAIRRPLLITGASPDRYAGYARISPSDFSFGLTGSLLVNSQIDSNIDPDTTLGLAGFVNIGGIDGISVLAAGDVGISGRGRLFRRDRILAIHDRPEQALRFVAGDLLPRQARLAGQVDLWGFGIERDYQALQPTRNVRPVGARGFLLERRSTVEVYVNGSLVRTFQAEPGAIDIRDIPGTELSNAVSIVVEDSLGRREIDNFTIGSDLDLLAAGLDEFSLNVGFLRSTNGFGFSYDDKPAASLFYARGMSETLTLIGHAVAAENRQNAGIAAAFAFANGVTVVETAASNTDNLGSGFAFGLSYRGDPFDLGKLNGFLNARASYQSQRYRQFTGFAGISDFKLDAAIDYRLDVARNASMFFGGSYFERYNDPDHTWASFLGMSYQIGLLSLSATARYASRGSQGDEFGGFFTLSMPLGRRVNAYASYDTASRTARTELRRRRDLDLPEIEYAIRAERSPRETNINGRFGYGTSRFEAIADVSRIDQRGNPLSPVVGSLRLQSGLAFVDGTLAIGRDPAAGFAVVRRHPSLEDAEVIVRAGSAGRQLAVANGLGPAVAPVLTPYRVQELSLDVQNAPPGYVLGEGEYLLQPGVRSGFAIDVGTDAFRAAIGSLLRSDGSPFSLVTGRLIALDSGEESSFFTNRVGRFSLTNLSPGRYQMVIDETDVGYAFEVTDEDPTLIRIGDVRAETLQ